MPEVPVLNVFPANVTTPSGVKAQVRAVVASGKVTLYGLVGGKIEVVAEDDVAEFTPRRAGGRRQDGDVVLTSSGETWEIRKAGGCGCGSRLKSFNPFGLPNRVGT